VRGLRSSRGPHSSNPALSLTAFVCTDRKPPPPSLPSSPPQAGTLCQSLQLRGALKMAYAAADAGFMSRDAGFVSRDASPPADGPPCQAGKGGLVCINTISRAIEVARFCTTTARWVSNGFSHTPLRRLSVWPCQPRMPPTPGMLPAPSDRRPHLGSPPPLAPLPPTCCFHGSRDAPFHR
jgi:hypothetical protein